MHPQSLQTPLHIIELRAENFKKLKAVIITPRENVVQITGPNGSGKTSVLDVIVATLGGTKHIDSMPLRAGETKGRVQLDLGDFIVTRRFSEGGAAGGSLTIESKDGTAQYKSPQTMLDKLIGPLTFDLQEFERADPKKQLDMLRALVTIDIDIDELDFDNRRDFEARTQVNRTAKELEAQLKGLGAIVPVDEPANVSQLLTQLEAAVEHNRNVDIEARRRADYSVSIGYKEQRIADMRAQLKDMEVDVQLMKDERDMWDKEQAIIDVGDLRTQIDAASEARRAFDAMSRAIAEREQLQLKFEHAEATAKDFTDSMARRTKQRTDAIAAAKMPVDGLGFGDGEVLFREIPFSQLSSAERLRIAAAIAMAGDPPLRVLRIKDGSLLDSKSLQIISDMAQEKNYQVWIERVDESGKIGIVLEDGEIVAESQS